VLAVAFSSNSRYLATGDSDGQILVRDALNWEILRRLPGHVAQITGLAWSPGSERLASSSRDGSVRVWDFETGRGLETLRHRGPVRAVVWDVLGEHLFSAGEDGAIHMWEASTGRVLRSFSEHEGAVVALDYDPVENRLISGSSDRTVRVWDVQRGTSVVLRGHEAPIVEVAFDPLEERVLSGDADGAVYLWAAEGDLSSTELVQHDDQVNALAFDPTGARLVSAANDHELVLWDALTGEPLRRLRDHDSFVNSVTWSADGRTFLSGSHDQSVFLWDAETGRVLRRYGAFDRWVVGAALTPDGSRVIVATGDRKVRVLDAETRLTLRELTGATSPADALAVGSAGRIVAAAGRELCVWDLAREGSEPLYAHKGRNTAVAISPDGAHLATGGLYGLVQVFDAASGALLASRQEQTRRIHALAWSPDSRRLASASEEGEIHVREARSGESLLVLREPRGPVTALAFSADGARLASGLRDGTIRNHETSPVAARREVRRLAEARTAAARERVDALFAERFRLEEVLRALESDRSLTQELREAALRLAYLRGDDPELLLARSLEECLEPEQPAEVYAFALERAAEAESLRAGEGEAAPRERVRELEARSALVRGIAFYRMKRFSDAADLLAPRNAGAGDTAASALPPRDEALRLLFLCMTQCQTSDHREAERSWRRAQQSVLNDVELSQSEELSGLLAEAETLVRSSAPPAGS
jgi:WD40 repeat protein